MQMYRYFCNIYPLPVFVMGYYVALRVNLFQPLELYQNTFLLFKALSPWQFVTEGIINENWITPVHLYIMIFAAHVHVVKMNTETLS